MSVLVGELTAARAALALQGRRADIVYTDPPWGPGNLQYWRTYNGEHGRPSWPAFLGRLCEVLHTNTALDGHVFVEMGLRWADNLSDEMARVGRPERARWACVYSAGGAKRPNVLWYSGPGTTTDPSGLSGVAMTRRALEGVVAPSALVFDPCCGKGMTARCAVRLGMRFAGVELNPARAAATQRWLALHDLPRT